MTFNQTILLEKLKHTPEKRVGIMGISDGPESYHYV